MVSLSTMQPEPKYTLALDSVRDLTPQYATSINA